LGYLPPTQTLCPLTLLFLSRRRGESQVVSVTISDNQVTTVTPRPPWLCSSCDWAQHALCSFVAVRSPLWTLCTFLHVVLDVLEFVARNLSLAMLYEPVFCTVGFSGPSHFYTFSWGLPWSRSPLITASSLLSRGSSGTSVPCSLHLLGVLLPSAFVRCLRCSSCSSNSAMRHITAPMVATTIIMMTIITTASGVPACRIVGNTGVVLVDAINPQ
jgi:hypothetical protein